MAKERNARFRTRARWFGREGPSVGSVRAFAPFSVPHPPHPAKPSGTLRTYVVLPLPRILTRPKTHPPPTSQAVFVGDEVEAIIKESIDAVLENAPYKHAFVGQWTNDVVELCVKRLAGLNKPFKYVVTCVIMQRNGAGLHTAASCFWDNDVDGSRTVRWENQQMYCVVTGFGLAL